MPEKDPNTWSWLSVVIGLGASFGGGFIRYREEMRYAKKFHLGTFLLDMFTSCFVGFMVFWVGHDVLLQPDALCACAAGFAGNMGASVFDFARHALFHRFGVKHEDKDFVGEKPQGPR